MSGTQGLADPWLSLSQIPSVCWRLQQNVMTLPPKCGISPGKSPGYFVYTMYRLYTTLQHLNPLNFLCQKQETV